MDVEKEYAPTLIPRPEPMRAREYIPQVSNPEQLSKIKKVDEMFSLNNGRQNEFEYGDDFKAESYALPAKFIAKDEAADQEIALKIQVLVDRLNEYKTKCTALRDTNLESAKQNFEKSKELEKLKIQNEQLESQLAELNVFDGKRGRGGVYALKNKSNADEEYRRKQEMRKELVMGIALVEGEFNDFSGRQDAKKNFTQKLKGLIIAFVNKFIVLKGEMKRIEANYDKSISSYFSFFKFVVNLSIFILGVYSYLIVSHILNFNDSLVSLCNGTLCFTLYYSFTTSEGFTYAFTFICMILVTVIFSIVKWIRADKIRRKTEIYGGNDAKLKKFSAIVFNAWPWSISTEIESEDQSVNISNLISTALKDHLRLREAANRTAKQKTALLGKRLIGSTIFFLILSTGWVVIILLAITEKDIAASFENSSAGLALFMKFLPKFGISIVNALFPALTLKITALESWDTPSFIIKIQIIRLYLAKVLNIILYALLNLELATSNSWFGSSEGRIPFESTSFKCREDQAGLNLVILVITEFIISKIIPLLMALLYWSLSKCQKASVWKKEIKVSQQVINLIYFQSLLWITFPYFPYVMILAPIFLYIDFKYQNWKLNKLQSKPLDQTQSFEVMILIMRLFNVTLIIVLAYFGYFLTVGITHGTYNTDQNCGAFLNLVPANTAVIDYMKSTVVLEQIWTYFLNYSPVFWIILLLTATRNFFIGNHLSLLKEYIEDKRIDTDNQIQELQKINSRLVKQNELNKKLA